VHNFIFVKGNIQQDRTPFLHWYQRNKLL